MQDKTDFLLEIGTEEVPAGYIPLALSAMKEGVAKLLKKERLNFEGIKTAGTPRRLVIHVSQLSLRQPDEEKEIIGPPKVVAFDKEGKPTKAAEGFARKNGVTVEELQTKDTPKGAYICIRKIEKGRSAMDILSDSMPELMERIPFPKTMRWGQENIRFARPVRWILALLGGEVVPFSFGTIKAGNITHGHRFMAPTPMTLNSSSFDSYLMALEEAFCIADPQKRKEKVLEEAMHAAHNSGGKLLEDNELLEVNTYLTEFPTAICGSFNEKFLSLPAPVLITCMKEHQKYFAVTDENGHLKANFIAINNADPSKQKIIKKGHERVIGARLSDADFFFQEDTKRPLDAFVSELEGMVFHKGLGTMKDKVKRLEHLTDYLCGCMNFKDSQTVKRAAYLCKADLCTEMVGEFPTLQGIMGKEYALVSGESEVIATAIEEHYMPIRSGGELPKSMAGTILSIADKMDNIVAAFSIGLKPSGNQDPYALRRQAIGVITILIEKKISLDLKALINSALNQLDNFLSEIPAGLTEEIVDFFKGRFKNELISRGIDYDVVDAAIAARFDCINDCHERAQALKAVRGQPEFEPISIAFKRVMNILKGFPGGDINKDLFEAEEENRLYKSYLTVKTQITPILNKDDDSMPTTAEDYKKALLLLLGLKKDIDDFFDNVMVMVDDEILKENRLSLLYAISRLFLRIGHLGFIVTDKKGVA